MGYFYFDESIQERGGFIIGAFVYSPYDVTPNVYAAIEQVGLRPGGIDEFKSGARMDRNPEQAELRSRLSAILGNTHVGVVVVSAADRASLGHEALLGLRKSFRLTASPRNRTASFWTKGSTLNLIPARQFSENLAPYTQYIYLQTQGSLEEYNSLTSQPILLGACYSNISASCRRRFVPGRTRATTPIWKSNLGLSCGRLCAISSSWRLNQIQDQFQMICLEI